MPSPVDVTRLQLSRQVRPPITHKPSKRPKNRHLSLHKIVGVLVNSALASNPGPVLTPPYRHVAERLQGALRAGDTWLVESSSPAVYSILRQSGAEAILVVLNLGTEAVSDYQLTLPAGPLTERLGQSHCLTQLQSSMVTVLVCVCPQSPQPSSTPAVMVYVPFPRPLRSH